MGRGLISGPASKSTTRVPAQRSCQPLSALVLKNDSASSGTSRTRLRSRTRRKVSGVLEVVTTLVPVINCPSVRPTSPSKQV